MHCKHSVPTAQHFYGLVGAELIGMQSELLHNPCCMAAAWKDWHQQVTPAESKSRTVEISGVWGHKMKNWAETRREMYEQNHEDSEIKWKIYPPTVFSHYQHWIYPLWQPFMSWKLSCYRSKMWEEKKKCTETMLCNSCDAKKLQKFSLWLLSHVHTYTMVFPMCLNDFSTNSRTLWTSPVAMTKSSGSSVCSISHMACGKTNRQIQCKCKWPLWYMILYCCIFDLKITHTRTLPAWEISTFLIWRLLTSSVQLWKEFNYFLLRKTMLYLIFNLFHSRDFFRGDFNMFTFELWGLL